MKIVKQQNEFMGLYEKIKNETHIKDFNDLTSINQDFQFSIERDYEFIVIKRFFDQAMKICSLNKTSKFFFMVLDPSPTKYFYKYFGSYNTYIFDSSDSGQVYIDTLNADPGGSSADCPIDNSFVVLVADPKMNWFVLANRSYEKSTAFFKDESLYKEALSIFEYKLIN